MNPNARQGAGRSQSKKDSHTSQGSITSGGKIKAPPQDKWGADGKKPVGNKNQGGKGENCRGNIERKSCLDKDLSKTGQEDSVSSDHPENTRWRQRSDATQHPPPGRGEKMATDAVTMKDTPSSKPRDGEQ